MSLREKIVIKLMIWLIEFIGKPIEGFYGFKIDEIIKELNKETNEVLK